MGGWRVKVDGQMEGLMDGWMDGCMGREGEVGERMNGWMEDQG